MVADAIQDATNSGDIVFDPFLRHPVPPASRLAALRDELQGAGIALRLELRALPETSAQPRTAVG